MKVDVLMNGKMSLIISPETEVEKMLLSELSKTPCDVKIVEKGAVLMNKQIENSLVISQQQITSTHGS